MSSIVTVVGHGDLAELVCSQLSPLYPIRRMSDFKEDVPEHTQLILVLHDGWHPSVHREAEQVLRSTGIPWLRGFVAFGEGVIGPLVRAESPGCSQCADMRRLLGGRDRKEMWMLQRFLDESGGIAHDTWASRSGLIQMSCLIAAESQKVLQASKCSLEERMLLIGMKTLASKSHFFLPDPLCPVCGSIPDDSRELARLSLKSSPKISRNVHRSRSINELKAFLLSDYLDYRTGFLNGKMMDLVSPFADVSVNLPMFGQDETTAGRTHSYADSKLTAIMEGLERYCGMAPRGKRTVIRDSYRHVAEHALHPVSVGLYAEEQYAKPGFPFEPFDPDQPIEWVWGYSFTHEAPILVPQLLAYYSSSCGNGFVYETSNGCALGGSLEEAILYGMMEVVERDSFLLTWYAQLPLPRLDLSSANDSEMDLMVDRIRVVAGYEVYLYNATMENGIPSIWAMAKNRNSKGLNLVCAAGAHPDPVKAAKSAIHELSGMLLTLNEKLETQREKYMQMLLDPSLVRVMDDHAMLYGLKEAEERLHFLLDDSRPLRTFEESFHRAPSHSDLTEELKGILRTFRELRLDVIVVDQTTPELWRNGLHCVKVLIPGMLPMTFGYHLTRLTGLERVLKVPAELGYVKQPLLKEQLNPHPHPFP